MQIQERPGFTLLEILLAIAILVALTGMVLQSVNVRTTLTSAMDAEHTHYQRQIEHAMYQRLVSKWELLNDAQLPVGKENAKPICRYQVTTDSSCVNLDGLVPGHMAALPVERRETNPNYTGYTVYKNSGRVLVVAAHLGEAVGEGPTQQGGGPCSGSATCTVTWDTADTTFEFLGNMTRTAAAALDSDTFVVAYRDPSGRGSVRVGSLGGGSITWDTPKVTFNAGNIASNLSVARLDGDTFVVAYNNSLSGNAGSVRVGTVAGGTVSWDTGEVVFNPATTHYRTVAALDRDTFVVAYRDFGSGGAGTVRVGTVAGGIVSWDTGEIAFRGGPTSETNVAALDSDTFVVAYRNPDDSDDYGTVRVGTAGGGTVTWDTGEVTYSQYIGYDARIAALDGDTFVVSYGDWGNSGAGTVRVGTVAGGGITWDTGEVVFDATVIGEPAIARLNGSTFVVAYRDQGNGDAGTVRVGTVTGGSVTWNSTETIFESTSVVAIDAAALDSDTFVLTYNDVSNSYAGTARIGTATAQ